MSRDIKKIFVAGAGTMGMSIALSFAKHGYEVTVYDISEECLEKGKHFIRESGNEALVSEFSYTTNIEDCIGKDFVSESIVEILDIKKEFWSKVSRLVDEDVILTSNTSGLSINAMAEAVKCPERFLGMHWFNPPHLVPLIEIIKGDATTDAAAKTVYEISKILEKKPIYVNKDVPGFAANRIQFTVLRELLYMVENGIVSYEDGDALLKYGLGLRYACLGPFEIADFGGLDTFSHISDYLFEDLCDDKEGSKLFREMVENGNLGVKSGKGIYDYSNGKGEEVIKYRDNMLQAFCDTLHI